MKPGSFLIPTILIALLLTTLVVVSCNKNSSGKPKLSLVSITKVVGVNDSMIATFKFSGGSVSGGTFESISNRINQSVAANPLLDTLTSPIPTYSASTGEYRYALPQNTDALASGGPDPDTLVFKFFTLTPDSISSDTIISPQVIILNQ
jgi:hypothetical protein